MSMVLNQAHNAIDRKLFSMKRFHHPGRSQPAFLTGLAHLYNLIPYQRRTKHAGLCEVEVQGCRVPTSDWILNLQILTSWTIGTRPSRRTINSEEYAINSFKGAKLRVYRQRSA